MKWKIAHGLADALDRVGATLLALCLIGGWFSEQFTVPKALGGIAFGALFVLLGVYTKVRLNKEVKDDGR